MITLELDPNTVRPGWTALIVVIVLAVIMVGLFVSMMRQMRKIKVAPAKDESAEPVVEETQDPAAAEPEQDRSRQHDGAT